MHMLLLFWEGRKLFLNSHTFKAVTEALMGVEIHIHIFVFCRTDFF